jgi:hypothetical protein
MFAHSNSSWNTVVMVRLFLLPKFACWLLVSLQISNLGILVSDLTSLWQVGSLFAMYDCWCGFLNCPVVKEKCDPVVIHFSLRTICLKMTKGVLQFKRPRLYLCCRDEDEQTEEKRHVWHWCLIIIKCLNARIALN